MLNFLQIRYSICLLNFENVVEMPHNTNKSIWKMTRKCRLRKNRYRFLYTLLKTNQATHSWYIDSIATLSKYLMYKIFTYSTLKDVIKQSRWPLPIIRQIKRFKLFECNRITNANLFNWDYRNRFTFGIQSI